MGKIGTSEKARENGNSERKCKVVCIKKKKDQRVEVQVPEVKFNLEWRLETKLGFFSFFFSVFFFLPPSTFYFFGSFFISFNTNTTSEIKIAALRVIGIFQFFPVLF